MSASRSSLGGQSVREAANAPSLVPLSSVLYRSRAVAPFSELELHRLVHSAQARNRAEAVSGVLIYDQGRFLQWLEGPERGVRRVWESVRHDARHTDVRLLGESSIPVRFFGDSAMALAKPHADKGKGRDDALDLPNDLMETLRRNPEAAPSLFEALAPRPAEDTAPGSLPDLVRRVFVPRLVAKHVPHLSVPLVIDPRVRELARLLVAVEPAAAFALIDRLRADGRSIAQLCAGLIEPAARALGELWQLDECGEFEVTMAMGHLQLALRRASLELPAGESAFLPPSMPHAVLVAPSPREPHVLASAVASEMFWRAGWDVSCEFPVSDAALGQLVRDHWFDVLDLSLSDAFSREDRLPAMAASIRAAHAHSLNPALTVIVDGRVFHDRPQAFAEVGADASSASALDVVSVAQQQVQRAD